MRATDFQKEVAFKLGLSIDESSYKVAAAQLMDFLESAIDVKTYANIPATENQKTFAKKLGINIEKDSLRVASSKISIAVNSLNKELIKKYDLKPGKQVKWKK